MDRAEFLTELKQDLGYAVRMMRRTPAFTAAALRHARARHRRQQRDLQRRQRRAAAVAAVPRRRAPARHVQMLYPDGTRYSSLSAPDFMSVRADSRVFEQIEAIDTLTLTLLGAGEPREINGAFVSGGMFDMLGFTVALGRGFLPEENQPGRGQVALLSHGFWQRVFGGDRGVLGRSITSGGITYTIVGVTSPESSLPDPADVYLPARRSIDTYDATTAQGAPLANSCRCSARARPGVTPAAIDADLKRIGAQLQTAFPESNDGLTFTEHAAARVDRRRRAAAAVRAARRGRIRAAGRVRERRQPAAGARLGAARRAVGARGARRRPGAADPAAGHRIDPARLDRRRARPGPRLLGHRGADRGAARRSAAHRRDPPRRHGGAVHRSAPRCSRAWSSD